MAADPSAKLVSLLASLRKQYPSAQAGLFADPPVSGTIPGAASGASTGANHHPAKSTAASESSNTVALESTAGSNSASSATGTLPSPATRGAPVSAAASRVHGVSAFLDHAEPILCEFVRAFMVWENTSARAAAVIKRLDQSLVDFNELRICMSDELLRLMGRGVPRVEERAQRLHLALNGVYAREHAVTLEHLATLSKREAREYLESLDGVPRFVSARVMLVCFSAHTAPVDSRIHRRLVEAQAAEVTASPDEVAGQLERRVRAGEMPETYALLQAWADDLTSKEEAKGEAKAAAKAKVASGGGASAGGTKVARDAAPAKAAAGAKGGKDASTKQGPSKSKSEAKAGDSKAARGKRPEPKAPTKPSPAPKKRAQK